MEYKHLGRTGLMVSRLCLGTMNFGQTAPEEESFAIMDRALEMGINFFDTADVYGGTVNRKGLTEEIIGRWLAQGGGRRERIALATKVYGRMSDRPNDGRCSAYHIRRACEDSLRRLQTDHIDLYQMHHMNLDVPWEEIWQAMDILVSQGKVTYVGSSNFAAWNIARANGIAEKRNFMGLVSEQSIYSLIKRQIELEVIPACRALGLGVLPYSPMGGGLLCGASKRSEEELRSRRFVWYNMDETIPRIKAYDRYCDELGLAPANVALAWTLHNPAVASSIVGPRTLEQLESNAEALSIELSQDALAKLDEIWPGPGGEAPKAYAW